MTTLTKQQIEDIQENLDMLLDGNEDEPNKIALAIAHEFNIKDDVTIENITTQLKAAQDFNNNDNEDDAQSCFDNIKDIVIAYVDKH